MRLFKIGNEFEDFNRMIKFYMFRIIVNVN